MAKINKKFLAFLDEKIERKEKLIIERNGLVPLDFDNLIRYLEVRKHYTTDIKEIKL